ncbi:MAG: PCRF domain-containing protein, partial [Atopobium sp.]|nr:PCRF domain-containing protein [Atopobium sp.]
MADTEVVSLQALAERLSEVEGYLHLTEKRQQISELEAESACPNFWNDAETAQKIMTQLASLRDDVAGIDRAKEKLGDAEAAFELGTELGDQASLDESQALAASLEKDLSELELSSWFT